MIEFIDYVHYEYKYEMKWNEMKFISSYSTNYKGFHGIL